MALEPRIEAVRATYGLAVDDFWQIKQNKQWVCKHAALEIVAVKAGIEWQPPIIIEANAPALVTSMIVTGKMGDRVEWATGETNQTNYSVVGKQPAYPWAMSEKRAKDRVVLKLVGIHGLVYSEDEMPTHQGDEAPKQEAGKPQEESKAGSRKTYTALETDMRLCKTTADLGRWWKDAECVSLRKSMPMDWQKTLHDEFTKLGFELKRQEDASRTVVQDIQDTFPGSIVDNERVMSTLEAGE